MNDPQSLCMKYYLESSKESQISPLLHYQNGNTFPGDDPVVMML